MNTSPIYYIPSKQFIPNSPKQKFVTTMIERKPTVLMIQQETVDAIDKLFYGKYEEPMKPTSFICY